MKNIIGLCGVTSTGKTTMATEIKNCYPDTIAVLDKISRKDIFKFAGLTIDPDLRLASEIERAQFDAFRVMLQIDQEIALSSKAEEYSKQSGEFMPVVVDGCALVKLAYLLYLSAPKVIQIQGEHYLTERIQEVFNHVKTYYSCLFYLPVERVPFEEADHRVFKHKYIRRSQDAILKMLISDLTSERAVNVEVFASTDMSLVHDELAKRGVSRWR